IGNFKNITAIIDDPQNVKNDISTFAGRMQEFSTLLNKRDSLVGVDEIELGTDSDEAAALFKVLLDELVLKNQKVVVTTHHKRLASLMADRDDVELMAAIYDEQNRTPTYEFMQGIIGKSYAFETALRYGVPNRLVSAAKELYGQNSEKLNTLIERGSTLERELREKHKLADEKLDELYKKELELKEQKEYDKKELNALKNSLRFEYEKAIDEAKKAAKEASPQAIHKAMNKAKELLPKKEYAIKSNEPYIFSIGDRVKYNDKKGVIVALKGSSEATLEIEGMRLRVKTNTLKPSLERDKKPKSEIKLQVEKKAGLKLDLHGLRADEAMENLDKFLSDALINGWDEVLVYHGIGSGKLAFAVKEFLKTHPKVKSFSDAPPHMGGFGAKVVEL
ncbi:MAG: Smr/MutS family protein, partial [Sulfurimonas sp.]